MSTSKYTQRFMDNKELFEKYCTNLKWLHRNIPPDDIYDFAEQTYMAALFFLNTINNMFDIKELLKNPIFNKWATNIITILELRDRNVDCAIDIQMDLLD